MKFVGITTYRVATGMKKFGLSQSIGTNEVETVKSSLPRSLGTINISISRSKY